MTPLPRTHIFPILSLLTDLNEEYFYVAFDVHAQIYFCHCFSFPNLLSGCSDNFCIFIPRYFSLLPPSLSYLFVSNFVQELFSQFSICRDVLLLSLKEIILDYHSALLGPSSLHSTIPRQSIREIIEVCSPEIQDNELYPLLPHRSQTSLLNSNSSSGYPLSSYSPLAPPCC